MRLSVRANQIYRNQAGRAGGGISMTSGMVRENVIAGNFAVLNGGGCISQAAYGEYRNNTVAYNETQNGVAHGAGITVTAAQSFTVTNNLVVGNRGSQFTRQGAGISCSHDVTARCNVLWQNDIDAVNCAPPTLNAIADPQFCAVDPLITLDFSIQQDSPCAASESGSCGLIGAEDVKCGTTSLTKTSWGTVKVLYR